MSQSSKIVAVGQLTVGPASVTVSGQVSGPSLVSTINLGHERNVAKRTADSISVAVGPGGTALPLGGIANVSYLFLRVLSGAVTVKLTWSGGTDQVFPLSGHWLWDNPIAPFITAITLIGPADVEYQLGGS